MIKGSSLQQNIISINVCASNTRASKYIKQALMYTKERYSVIQNTVIVMDLNISLSVMNQPTENQQNSLELNYALDQIGQNIIYR